jgi:hypothetical protein
VEEILDIPDPVEKAVAAVKKLTPEEQARRDEAKRVLRTNAQKEVDTHDPVKIAALKHSWLIFTVPEKPVAGAVWVWVRVRSVSAGVWGCVLLAVRWVSIVVQNACKACNRGAS